MIRSVFQVGIDFAGHSIFIALGEKCRDETQAGRGIGEDRCDTSAALDLAIDVFKPMISAQPRALRKRRFKHGEAVRQILLGPLRDWVETLLDEVRLPSKGYPYPAPIRQKWKEHLSGQRNWQYWPWHVLKFQAWRERWQ